jgi:hypothetical protein
MEKNYSWEKVAKHASISFKDYDWDKVAKHASISFKDYDWEKVAKHASISYEEEVVNEFNYLTFEIDDNYAILTDEEWKKFILETQNYKFAKIVKPPKKTNKVPYNKVSNTK